VKQPAPGRFAIADLWNATLTTTGGPTEAYLEGVLLCDGDTVLRAFSSNDLALTNGTRQLESKDVTGTRSLYAKQGYEELAVRDGTPPADWWDVCLLVLDARTNQVLGSHSIKAPIRTHNPPRLISPKDGAVLPEAQRTPLFTWLAPFPKPSGHLTYSLTLAEVLPGQTPEEALRANPPWFTKTGITGTDLQYAGTAFEKGKKYAWQVVGMVGRQEMGPSEAFAFSTGVGTRVDSVHVDLYPPPNNQLTRDDLWHARLTNLAAPETVYLRGYIMVNNDTVLKGRSTNTLFLEVGTREIRSHDITGVRDLRCKEGYESLATGGGNAPTGSYVACLDVYESGSNRSLGHKCIGVTVSGGGTPPPPDTGAVSIALRWNAPSTDLDLYLIGDKDTVCWHKPQDSQGHRILDVDDTDGYGPESIRLALRATGDSLAMIGVHYYGPSDGVSTQASIVASRDTLVYYHELRPTEWWSVGTVDLRTGKVTPDPAGRVEPRPDLSIPHK
jgi:hypothetical protein